MPYHMIGAESVEQRLLGGYYDLVSKLHPDHPPAGLFPSDALVENASRYETKWATRRSLRP